MEGGGTGIGGGTEFEAGGTGGTAGGGFFLRRDPCILNPLSSSMLFQIDLTCGFLKSTKEHLRHVLLRFLLSFQLSIHIQVYTFISHSSFHFLSASISVHIKEPG